MTAGRSTRWGGPRPSPSTPAECAKLPTCGAPIPRWNWPCGSSSSSSIWSSECVPRSGPAMMRSRFALNDQRHYLNRCRNDEQWLRLLDVDAALVARTYNGDDAGHHRDHRPDVRAQQRHVARRCRRCRRVAGAAADDADLATDINGISAAYMGSTAWHDLLVGGHVQQRRAARWPPPICCSPAAPAVWQLLLAPKRLVRRRHLCRTRPSLPRVSSPAAPPSLAAIAARVEQRLREFLCSSMLAGRHSTPISPSRWPRSAGWCWWAASVFARRSAIGASRPPVATRPMRWWPTPVLPSS